MICVRATLRLGATALDVDVSAPSDALAICGASGAGKTTLLNVVAGLRRPERGRITVDDDVLFDSERGIDLPPARRGVGYVFQDGRLFPHLSVRGNLTYARRFATRRAIGRTRVAFDDVVALLGLSGLLERRPAGLSGGEKQRVAIGRALLADPRLLLLDEPLAALDDARREDILAYIVRIRDDWRLPIIFVSHDAEEVARVAVDVFTLGRAIDARETSLPLGEGQG